MEKNITLKARQETFGMADLIALISEYYSQVLERPINNHQTLLLIHAQVAFLFAAFPVNCPLVLLLGLVVWVAAAVSICKQSLGEDDDNGEECQ